MTEANDGVDAAAEAAYQRAKSEVGALPRHDLIERIEHGGFEGGSGPLVKRLEWVEIKRRVLDVAENNQAHDWASIPRRCTRARSISESRARSTAAGLSSLATTTMAGMRKLRVKPPLKFEDALQRLMHLAIESYPESEFAKRFGRQ